GGGGGGVGVKGGERGWEPRGEGVTVAPHAGADGLAHLDAEREKAGRGELDRRRDREIAVGDELERVERGGAAGAAGDDPAELELRKARRFRQAAEREGEDRRVGARREMHCVRRRRERVVGEDLVDDERRGEAG